MQWFIAQNRVRARLHLSSYDEHEACLFALVERIDREPGAITKAALKDLLSRYEARGFDFERVTCYECQTYVLYP